MPGGRASLRPWRIRLGRSLALPETDALIEESRKATLRIWCCRLWCMNSWFSQRIGIPTATARRPARRVFDPGGRGLPRGRPLDRGRWYPPSVPEGTPASRSGQSRVGPATQFDTGEDCLALAHRARCHHFPTELWTTLRLGQLIGRSSASGSTRVSQPWLREQDSPPRSPGLGPERDPEAIAAWLASDWPRIKKKRGGMALHRPDRRERPADGTAGSENLGTSWRTPNWHRRVGAAGKGLDRGGRVARQPRSAGPLLRTLANGYFDSWYMAAFLEAMMKDLGGRFVVVWDGGPMHKGEPIRALVFLRRPIGWRCCRHGPRCSTRWNRFGVG